MNVIGKSGKINGIKDLQVALNGLIWEWGEEVIRVGIEIVSGDQVIDHFVANIEEFMVCS